jgi:hypothetical protein
MQTIEVPEAARREERTVFVAGKEEQPAPTAIFIAADEAEHGCYDCEYYGMDMLGKHKTRDERNENLQAP